MTYYISHWHLIMYLISICWSLVKISYLRFNITFSYYVYSHIARTQVTTADVLEILYFYSISYLNWDFKSQNIGKIPFVLVLLFANL